LEPPGHHVLYSCMASNTGTSRCLLVAYGMASYLQFSPPVIEACVWMCIVCYVIVSGFCHSRCNAVNMPPACAACLSAVFSSPPGWEIWTCCEATRYLPQTGFRTEISKGCNFLTMGQISKKMLKRVDLFDHSAHRVNVSSWSCLFPPDE